MAKFVKRSIGAVLLSAVCSLSGVSSAAAAVAPGQGTWETTLQGRDLDGDLSNGYEAFYDVTLNLTWLADANLAAGGDTTRTAGFLTFADALTWTSGLVVHGVSGWRLPQMVDIGGDGCNWGDAGTDCGFNVDTSKSELAHLYYVTLGNIGNFNTSGFFQEGGGMVANTGPFKNVQSFDPYWLQNPVAGQPEPAWVFANEEGSQYPVSITSAANAWAVRSGDIATAVPEPSTYLLMLAGLAAIGFASKRRQAK